MNRVICIVMPAIVAAALAVLAHRTTTAAPPAATGSAATTRAAASTMAVATVEFAKGGDKINRVMAILRMHFSKDEVEAAMKDAQIQYGSDPKNNSFCAWESVQIPGHLGTMDYAIDVTFWGDHLIRSITVRQKPVMP